MIPTRVWIGLVVGLAIYSILQYRNVSSLQESLSQAQTQLSSIKASVEIRAESDLRLMGIQKEKDAVDYELSISGGQDPLSGYLAESAKRLWP